MHCPVMLSYTVVNDPDDGVGGQCGLWWTPSWATCDLRRGAVSSVHHMCARFGQYDTKFLKERNHSTPVHGWVRGAVVKESNEGREVSLGVVVLDDGKESVDVVVDLSVRSGSQLVHGKGVVGFRVLGESVEDDPFEEFCE